MSIYISDALVAGDTTVSIAPSPGSLAFSGQDAAQAVGVSAASNAGAITLTGIGAASSIGVSVSPEHGSVTVTGEASELTIGARLDANPGTASISGLTPFAVARGRIAVVSGRMVLKSNPPTPFVCLAGIMNDETTLGGRLVDEVALSGYYQLDSEECE